MAGDITIAIIGNLTVDLEMYFTPFGAAVASFIVASMPRIFDRQAGEQKDGRTLFMRYSIQRGAAENVAESLTKGTRVIVQGRLVQCSCTTREGENRTVVEVQVDEIDPSPRYAKAQVTRQLRGGGQDGFGGDQGGPQGNGFGDDQGGQSGYNQDGSQQGGYDGSDGLGGQGQSGYNASAGGAAGNPWATDGLTSSGDGPPF